MLEVDCKDLGCCETKIQGDDIHDIKEKCVQHCQEIHPEKFTDMSHEDIQNIMYKIEKCVHESTT